MDDSISSILTFIILLYSTKCSCFFFFRGVMKCAKISFPETSAPCCTAKPHQGGRDRKTEGCHPEADLGNNLLAHAKYIKWALLLLLFFFTSSSFYCTLSRSDFGKAVIQLIRVHTNYEGQRRKTLQGQITLLEYCLDFESASL